ncbi:YecA family protein [Piscinibacter sp.]|uniref:YecA/YgfB family protein n=1 Tax=Piscinibacter sp. TaxID=1903157 RepID=UPI002C78D55D|nr:YecA family protein [Albitalea sp.]HUG26329.1 YecA family protein [Albitalea sp.]
MPAPPRRPHATATPRSAAEPLSESELDELQALLDRVPAPLEPLDVSMLDGFLCGVLVQPQAVPESRWLAHVTDADGRALPPRFDATRLHAFVRRRHAELNDAIARRQWFDPWVFELDDDDAPATVDDDEAAPPAVAAVYPWVAGFATAQEFFPALMQLDAQAITEPLALLYRHLDPEDLEDADDLLEEIESLEPPVDLAEAVEGLVRAVLLLADASRPLAPATSSRTAHRPRRR